MNPNAPPDDPQTRFYDLDYPWPEDPVFAQAIADPFIGAAVRQDIELLLHLAEKVEVPILDLCCGTGRLTMPLARAGHTVVGVDISPRQIAGFRARLAKEPPEVQARVTALCEDICKLDLEPRFGFAFVGFNSINLLNDKDLQRIAIGAAAACLMPGGSLLVELLNPFRSSIFGAQFANPMATRTDPDTGLSYIKFGVPSAMLADQKQVITGWYDVTEPDKSFRRSPFTMGFRFIFPHELELMFELAGLETKLIAGEHQGAAYGINSSRLIGIARKPN